MAAYDSVLDMRGEPVISDIMDCIIMYMTKEEEESMYSSYERRDEEENIDILIFVIVNVMAGHILMCIYCCCDGA